MAGPLHEPLDVEPLDGATADAMAAMLGTASLDVIADLHRRALTALESYRPDEAAALLSDAQSGLDTLVSEGCDSERADELRTRVLLAASWAAYERHGPDAAESLVARAADLARATSRGDLITLCHLQTASMRGRAGDLPGSLRAMQRAEDGLAGMPLTDQARLLTNRGVLAAQLMRLREAEADLHRGVAAAHEAGAPVIEFMARHNLGWVHYLRGDLPRALAVMNEADAMPAEVNRAVSRLDRARVLLEAGLLDEARALLGEARQLADADGVAALIGEIELDLARTLLVLGDAPGSASLARTARRRFRGAASAGWRRRAYLVELDASARSGVSLTRTARTAVWLARVAVEHDDDHVARRAALVAADALSASGDVAAAAGALRQTSGLAQSASLPTRLQLRLVAARIAAPDRPRAAARQLSAAADDLAAAQQRASSLDLRTALGVHGERLATLDLDLGFESRSVVSLFNRSERWRAVSDRVPLVRPPRDPQAADLLTQLRGIREELRDAPLAEQADLRARAIELERAVRALDWARPTEATGAAPGPSRPLGYAGTLAAVRAAAATLATFLPHAGHLYAVVLGERGGRIVRLGRVADIDALARRVRADLDAVTLPMAPAMRQAVERSLTAALTELDDALLGALCENGSARRTGTQTGSPHRLVVVPSRVIAAVPFGMLPSRRGLATTVARTAMAWASAAARPPVARPQVLAIAGPDLRHADREVADIGRLWSAPVVSSHQATRAEIVSGLVGRDLVHIAAHGQHHYQSPLFSTLRLSDGLAFAHELPDAGVTASHIVLSACEVGRATIRPGDESLGLTAVLLSMGVQTVVAAVARIPDELAADAMTAYHRLLVTGVDSATALAQATADHPTVARAFTCFGADWRATRA